MHVARPFAPALLILSLLLACTPDAPPSRLPQHLTPVQIDDLVLLGKVWGFAKYYHPRITSGQVDWDHELLAVLPDVLAAPDRAATTKRLSAWLAALGDPAPCQSCATLPTDAALLPDLDWIRDRKQLGSDLADRLQRIYRNRPADGKQYYVALAEGVGNPEFTHEATYAYPSLPDANHRLLALFRFWNIIEYWYPNRDLLEGSWEDVLREFIPRVMAADEAVAYRLGLMQITARIHDTHANLWKHLALRPPRGLGQLPVRLRFVEGKAVVTGFTDAARGRATGLQVGDVIEAIDGARVDSLVVAWRPYYAASNEPTRLRDMAASLMRGKPGPVRISGERAGRPLAVTAKRIQLSRIDLTRPITHDLPGDAFQRLSDDVAYLKLSAVVAGAATDYIRRAAGTRVLVIDIRNYPRAPMVFELGSHLVTRPTPFACFTRADPANPGAFVWTDPVILQPVAPRYRGKVVILVDEVTQSQGEYTAMAFRAAPGAIVVGSTTAGADGNISPIPLPGDVTSMISGIGVFYPDRRPTQRVGIVPDLVVRPTIAGIRTGRDEVLEAGVSRALGHPFRLPAGSR